MLKLIRLIVRLVQAHTCPLCGAHGPSDVPCALCHHDGAPQRPIS
ncbi:MAG: hypothetical protein RIS94_100 [Pseudomonadota bacterium]|jgi:hypothetical protein